jgi:glycosyltransferase involved in cell wall biosynthesis
MRVLYLDPGLHDDVGHHANYCRYIVGELRGRGVETLVFGHEELPARLQAELGAAAHFRVYTYTDNDDDPFCAWLTGFDTHRRTMIEDLSRLPPVAPGDLVFMNSVRPIQVAALVEWRSAMPTDRRPTIVVDAIGSGLDISRISGGLKVLARDPRTDPRSALFRYVAKRLPREEGARFHFGTFGPVSTEVFRLLLDFPVRTLPSPFRAVAPLRNRAGARPVTISILGHQRLLKGYDLLPDIARELLRARPDIRLFVQNVASPEGAATQQTLREMAQSTERLAVEETPAGKARWAQLLEMADLVVCPYRPQFYIAGFSAVLNEAVANGLPVVVPAGTTLETLVRDCGGPGTVFERFDPASIVAATSQLLDRFDHFATIAYTAALRWPETRGPARLVDELLSLVAAR